VRGDLDASVEEVFADAEEALDDEPEVHTDGVGEVRAAIAHSRAVEVVGNGAGDVSHVVGIDDSPEEFVGIIGLSVLKTGECEVDIFSGKQTASGEIPGIPIRGPDKSAVSRGGEFVLKIGFREAKHPASLKGVVEFAIDGMIDGGEFGGGVEEFVSEGVFVFGEKTTVGEPESLLGGGVDAVGACGVGLGIATDAGGDFREEAIGAVVVGGRLSAFPAVVVMAVGDPGVEEVLIETIAVGVEVAGLEGEDLGESVESVAAGVEISGPPEIVEEHIDGYFLHVVSESAAMEFGGDEAVPEGGIDGEAFGMGMSAEMAEDAIVPADHRGTVADAPSEVGAGPIDGAVAEDLFIPAAIHAEDVERDRQIEHGVGGLDDE